MNEILIFSTNQTNRLAFVLDFIFANFTNLAWRSTNDQQVFQDFSGPKINYSKNGIDTSEIQIIPEGFLGKSSFYQLAPTVEVINNTTVLFPTDKTVHPNAWQFDLFSAIFFMLSRYEEYDNPAKDQFGRFPAKESIAFKHHFLQLPVVDIWVLQLTEYLAQKYPTLNLLQRKLQVNFTYDIDIAYAYKARSVYRQLGAIGKDMLKKDFKRLLNRLSVLWGSVKDPFDNYSYMAKSSINPIFFFLLAEKKSQYDHNINPKSTTLQKLVKKVKGRFPIGIHPSFYSSIYPEKITTEKKILEKISGEAVTKSRQHYLKFNVPDTYKSLIDNDIIEDYSMGFAEMPGFRAGTCTSFNFFDLAKNESTPLKIFPCCIMESMFRDDIIIPAQEALPYFIQYFEEVKKVNGHFMPIWHNDTLQFYSNQNDPKNFRWLHDEILGYIRNFTY